MSGTIINDKLEQILWPVRGVKLEYEWIPCAYAFYSPLLVLWLYNPHNEIKLKSLFNNLLSLTTTHIVTLWQIVIVSTAFQIHAPF